VHFVHVYGHQDAATTFDALPRLTQINIEMDLKAKTRLRSLISTHSLPAAPLRYEGWRCTLNGVKLSSDPTKAIYKSVIGKQLQQHLHAKNILPSDVFSDVDWDALESATDHFPPLYRLWMSKHVSGFFPIGKMMKNWEFWDHQRCPCCSHVKEDKVHLLTCPEPSCVAKWADSVQGLAEWLRDMDTLPAIRRCVVAALSARTVTQSFHAVGDESVVLVAADQDRIGWINFTEGKISRRWRQLQGAHYRATNSLRTPEQWAAGLITSLLSMVHSQWTHRCNILHARDAQGLRLQEAQALAAAITFQFQTSIEGLRPRDHHLITRGQDRVLQMTGSGKLSWLSSIRIAREELSSQMETENENMRNMMAQYLHHY
jgi:hypothetical protein